MKIIPKFLGGGGFDNFFTVYTPVKTIPPQIASSDSSSSKKSKSSDSEKGKLTEKDLFSMLKEIDGLPNEMKAIVDGLLTAFRLDKLAGKDTEDLAADYISNLYKIKIAALNKLKYDEAIKTAKENGSMGEPAISMSGKLLVLDLKGEVKEVSLEEFHQSDGNYKALSVSLLANMRAYQPSLNNNLEIFNIINNSMGYEAFQALLKEGLTALGTSELTRNDMNPLSIEAKKGLEMLGKLSPEERMAVLSGSIEGTTITKDQVKLAQFLTSYLAAMLPNRAKTWAAYKLGIDDITKATAKLVGLNLSSTLSDSSSIKLEYDSFYNKNKDTATAKKEDSDIDKIKLNGPAKFLAGYGLSELFVINPGSSTNFIVQANTMTLTNAEDKPIGPNASLQTIFTGNYSRIFDLRNVSMGGVMIDSGKFDMIIASDGKVSSIDFPYIEKDGDIKPALSKEIYDRKNAADRKLRLEGIDVTNIEDIRKNYTRINLVYLEYKLDPKYDSNGNPTNWKRFAVINAATDGRVLGEGADRLQLKEITDDIEADALEAAILKGVSNYKVNKPFDIGIASIGGDALYKGTVWIPLNTNYNAALDDNLTPSLTLGLDKLDQLNELLKIHNNPQHKF